MRYSLLSSIAIGLLLFFTANLLAQPVPPEGFTARAFERHIELRWHRTADPTVSTYRLYRENPSGEFELIRTLLPADTLVLDWTGDVGVTHRYTISSRTATGIEGDTSIHVEGTTFEMTDDAFMDMVQEYTFRYFWDFAHPVSGLARERNTSGNTVTTGGSGFGIMAILVGIERGFITREQGLERLLQIVLFLETANRFHGVFPHWMHGATGTVVPFSTMDNGGDLVETAFLFQGLLTVREYFNGNSVNEIVLRQKITDMWEEANWDWYRNNQNVLLWHWSPTFGFAINLQIRGWNEGLIIYLLGIASPTHAINPSLYQTGWAGGSYVNGSTRYGHKLYVGSNSGGPLFFAHYSFLGFDPRYYQDQYANYFVHNRNHTLVNRAYCIDNPENHTGYSDVCWGLTASDDPLVGYLAHDATPSRDNGTITPTAALSSMPYTPDESIEALKHFYRAHGERLWGPMGFYDAFNLNENWFATSYLAIDQGPIICMIENHRTQLLWDFFMQNPEITEALDAIGFVPDSVSVGTVGQLPESAALLYPNPVSTALTIFNTWNAPLTLEVIAMDGHLIAGPISITPGTQHRFSMEQLPPGVYCVRLSDQTGAFVVHKVTRLH